MMTDDLSELTDEQLLAELDALNRMPERNKPAEPEPGESDLSKMSDEELRAELRRLDERSAARPDAPDPLDPSADVRRKAREYRAFFEDMGGRGASWEEASKAFKQVYPDVDPSDAEAEYPKLVRSGKMNRIRREVAEEYGSKANSVPHWLLRSAVGVFRDPLMTYLYGAAKRRYDAGEGNDSDARAIAIYELFQNADFGGGLGTAVASSLLRVPGLAAEFQLTGGLLKVGAAATGLRSALASAPVGVRMGLVGALSPSMTATPLMQRNIEQGKDPLDIASAPAAVARSFMAMTIMAGLSNKLDSLIPGMSWKQVASRVAAQSVVGPAITQAADVATNIAGLDTGWGTIGDIVRGDYDAAVKQIVMDVATNAAFQVNQEAGGFFAQRMREAKARKLAMEEAARLALQQTTEVYPEIIQPLRGPETPPDTGSVSVPRAYDLVGVRGGRLDGLKTTPPRLRGREVSVEPSEATYRQALAQTTAEPTPPRPAEVPMEAPPRPPRRPLTLLERLFQQESKLIVRDNPPPIELPEAKIAAEGTPPPPDTAVPAPEAFPTEQPPPRPAVGLEPTTAEPAQTTAVELPPSIDDLIRITEERYGAAQKAVPQTKKALKPPRVPEDGLRPAEERQTRPAQIAQEQTPFSGLTDEQALALSAALGIKAKTPRKALEELRKVLPDEQIKALADQVREAYARPVEPPPPERPKVDVQKQQPELFQPEREDVPRVDQEKQERPAQRTEPFDADQNALPAQRTAVDAARADLIAALDAERIRTGLKQDVAGLLQKIEAEVAKYPTEAAWRAARAKDNIRFAPGGLVESQAQKYADALAGGRAGQPDQSGPQPTGSEAQTTFSGPRLIGAETQIVTPKKEMRRVKGRFEIRELDDVHASHEAPAYGIIRPRPGHPKGLQPRNYDTDANEQAKIMRIADDLIPEYMINTNPDATSGPPSVTEDGTAINGNGRLIALKMALHSGKYDEYRKLLIESAEQFGFKPDEVAAFRNPALVRVVEMSPSSWQARMFADVGNVSSTQEQSPARAGASLGNLIDDSILNALKLDSGRTFSEIVSDKNTGRAYRRALWERVPETMRSKLFLEGPDRMLTETGKEIVQSMLLTKAMPVEAVEDAKSIGNARLMQGLEGATMALIKIKRDFPYGSPVPQMHEAFKAIAESRIELFPAVETSQREAAWAKRKAKLDQELRQKTLTGESMVDVDASNMLLEFIVRYGNYPAQFRDRMNRFVNELRESQTGMFREENPDVAEMAARTLGVDKREGALFGAMKEVYDVQQEARVAGLTPEETRQIIEEAQREVEADLRRSDAGDAGTLFATRTAAVGPADRPKPRPGASGVARLPMERNTIGEMGADDTTLFLSRPATGEPNTVTPGDIVATQNYLFGSGEYVAPRTAFANALATATPREQKIIISSEAANNPLISLEENVHNYSVKYGFNPDPKSMPPGVAEGFREFYDQSAPVDAVTMLEGLAAWAKRRTTGELWDAELTPNQIAASAFAEDWSQSSGMAKLMDRVGELYRGWAAQSVVTRAAGLMSGGSSMPQPVMTRGEAVESYMNRFRSWYRRAFLDRIDTLEQIGATEAAKVVRYLEGAEIWLADRLKTTGVMELRNGYWRKIGKSKDELMALLKPEDLERVPGRDVTKIGLYTLARHIVNESIRQGTPVREHPRARNPSESGYVDRNRRLVPEWELNQFREALTELRQDADFASRAEAFADAYTETMNAMRDALASPDVHLLDQEVVDYYKEVFPDYVPTDRLRPESGWKSWIPRRGDYIPPVFRQRSGGGQPIIDPLVSLEQRYRRTAYLLTRQLRDNAIAEFLLQPGNAKYGAVFHAHPKRSYADRVQAIRASKDLSDADKKVLLDVLGGDASLFTYQPWPESGDEAMWYWNGPNGQEVAFRIKDRALYEIITGTIGDNSPVTMFLRGLKNLTIPMTNIRPVKLAADIQRTAATGISASWQFANIPRDARTFLGNTTNWASAAKLPQTLATAYRYEWDMLLGKQPKDRLFDEFVRNRGRESRAFAVMPISTIRTPTDYARQAINVLSSAELAPRYVEWLNEMEAMGYSEKKLRSLIAQADAAAAMGLAWRDPIPWSVIVRAGNAAAEVTVNFNRQGYITREVNSIVPFFGPTMAAIDRQIRNWKNNPSGAAAATGLMLSMRLMHWLYAKDQPWYEELSASDRYKNYVVAIGGQPFRIRGPQEFGDIGLGATMLAALDAATNRNPDVKGALRQLFEATTPPSPVPVPLRIYDMIRGNENAFGAPVVPKRDEKLNPMDKFTRYQLPFAINQLTAGRTDVSGPGLAASLLPVSPVRNARRSLDEFYETYNRMEGDFLAEKRDGRKQAPTAELAQMRKYYRQITELAKEAQTASPERKKQIDELKLKLARQALKK